MPRNMSFSLTTEQIRNRTKTVTRRLGWKHLSPGEIVNACVKCQGLKPGETIERLAEVRVISVRRESLEELMFTSYGKEEAAKEGFPGMTGHEFVEMFCDHMRVTPPTEVTRIEFEYLDDSERRTLASIHQ